MPHEIHPWLKSKSFDLRGARQYLDKLECEVHELGATPASELDNIAYRSINCAITAWHMCDWVYAECERGAEVRARLAKIVGREIAGLADVQAWARTERPIAICRQIATAGKHFNVTQYPDPAVQATYQVGDSGLPARDVDGWSKFVIYDGQEVHRPHHVFVRAHLFWKLALDWLEIR